MRKELVRLEGERTALDLQRKRDSAGTIVPLAPDLTDFYRRQVEEPVEQVKAPELRPPGGEPDARPGGTPGPASQRGTRWP